jgi:hypothetical protein
VKKRRVGDWLKQHDSAHEALSKAESSLGDRRTLDVLDEAVRASAADGPVDGNARFAAARRLGRSVQAKQDKGYTEKEADAHVIFEAAAPLLQKHLHRPPWKALASRLQHQLLDKNLFEPEITAERLRMICRQRGRR